MNSEDGKQTNEEEQPESDHELPKWINLSVQKYEGQTSEGHFHGEGVACFERGHMYKGMFSKGLMDGHGVFKLADGLMYEGGFSCNIPMGQGTYTWPDGSSYQGEVHRGIRHGTGTYKCAKNDMLYTGQWDQGKRHGQGAVYYKKDKTSWYKGEWVKNNIEGHGVRRYPSGNIYSGEWKNNLRHGEGTMTWLKLGQQYTGMWQNGVQHGQGTLTWITRRADGSQYFQSNRYIGEFVQGQRHGQGTFYYASGVVDEEEWRRRSKKHGKGKFTLEDGHVFEGEFVDDHAMTHDVAGLDINLNIEQLLEKIPERKRHAERKQVESVVLWQVAELRSVYSFYSRLGHACSPDNTFLLSRLQLWRLLKDCNVHHHGVTLRQVDHFIREAAPTAEIHSPFTPILLHVLVNCLVVLAYHIYHEELTSQNNLLAACFSKLMTDDILPNSKNVKGFLFRQPDCAVVAMKYSKKCWEVYQAYCEVHDQTMSCRHLLWMFKDLHLLDNNLTTARLVQIINAESRDPSCPSSCLDLEITFLEFFEVLLGSAAVKCQPETSKKLSQTENSISQSVADLVDPHITPEMSSPKSVETCDPESPPAQDTGNQQDVKPQPAEHTEAPSSEGKHGQTRGSRDSEVELWNQTINHFFNHFFFPAFKHNQLVRNTMHKPDEEPDGTQVS